MKHIGNRGWSNISQELFWAIYKKLKRYNFKIWFATNDNGVPNYKANKEYRINYDKNEKWYRLDFYIEDVKILIEYDCKRFHNEEKDIQRQKKIESLIPNITIFRLNHEEYIRNKDKILRNILKSIRNVIKSKMSL